MWTTEARRSGGPRVAALAGGIAVGLHGLLAFGLAIVDPKQFHPERPIEISVEERLPPPEVKPPPPEIKPPPVEPPKPRVVRRLSQMTEPQPIPPAPPPPNQDAPPKQEAPPVFGGSLSSVVAGDANMAVPVGNTLMTKPTTAGKSDAKPYSGEGTRAFVPVADLYIAKYPQVECPDAAELYPDEAKKLGLEGMVRFKLGIDEQGKLVSIKIIERAGHGFDEAATKAMRLCKFTPAVSNDGRPVPCTHSWGYRFELAQ